MSVTPPVPDESLDPLHEALHWLRLSGTFYSCAELTTPWGIELPAFSGCMMFHVVTEGRSWLDVPGAEPRFLEAGTLALVTRATGHAVRSAPDARDTPLFNIPAEKLSERCEILRHGGEGLPSERTRELCRATCGVVRLEHAAAAKIVELLPPVIEFRPGDDADGVWLSSTIGFVAREASSLRPGAEAIITRLADILVIQALRSWLATADGEARGYFAALSDPQLGRALALMHERCRDPLDLGSLAKAVGMSRSAFAERFSKLVGKPAMAYFADLRLRTAFEELRHSPEPVATIAARSGYQSEAAFTRAFRRAFGRSPTSVRRSK